jgi:serine/threonine-protein kinase HSL1, negative regulator of Swe1 kinase
MTSTQQYRRAPFGDARSRGNTPFVQTPNSQPYKDGITIANGASVQARTQRSPLSSKNPNISPANQPIPEARTTHQSQGKRLSAISTASSNNSARANRRKSHIGPWQLGKTIGRGGCSRVRAVRNIYTGQYGAAKIISKSFAENARAQSLANLIKSAESDASLSVNGKVIPFGLEREIVIMKLLEHQNIVRLYDVWENHNEL